jgi:putative chitinase
MSLVALQKKMGIEADGKFGPGTLKAAMKYFTLTPARAAHFFAQTAHETGNFLKFAENLNYSADGLLKIFGKYFDTVSAVTYSRNPEKIANRVYANRMGNGDEASGDGWKFRGRGAIQLTGKENYQAFADKIGRPEIMDNPDLVATTYSFESAMFFFNKNKLWATCDFGPTDAAILALTKRINGGNEGLDDRSEKTKKYFGWLKSELPVIKDIVFAPAPKPAQSADVKLSTHFYLKDFIKSETATRKRIDNTPTLTHLENLKQVCEHILEPVYANFKKPIRINSAYRGPKLNKAVGGSAKSQHCNGEAVDFEIDGVPNPVLAAWVANNLNFDQIILEFYNPKEGPNSGWVHCSYKKNNNRKSILTAVNVKGKTVYKPGFVI